MPGGGPSRKSDVAHHIVSLNSVRAVLLSRPSFNCGDDFAIRYALVSVCDGNYKNDSSANPLRDVTAIADATMEHCGEELVVFRTSA